MANPKSRLEKQKAWTEHIQTAILVKKLNEHVVGSTPMTQTQIQAAKILLGKTIPDLKAVEHSGEVTGVVANHFHF